MAVLVIGVDPGDSTGVAAIRNTELITAWQGPANDAVTAVEILLGHYRYDAITVACERYVQRRAGRATEQPTAQRVSGAVERLAADHNAYFHLQGASEAWAAASNEFLRKVGMWTPARDVGRPDADDANMATRHALLGLMTYHAQLFEMILLEAGA